jgi:hypothetical protein
MNARMGAPVGAVMRVLLGVLWLVAGCGSSSPDVDSADDAEETAEQAEQRRRWAEYDALMEERPDEPYEVAHRRAFRTGDRCGQGPYRVRFDGVGARYGEDYTVYACSPRAIRGDYRVDTEDDWRRVDARAWGDGQDNERCVASETERAGAGEGPAPEEPAPAANGRRRRRGSRPAEPPVDDGPRDLEEVDAAGFDQCPDGTRRIEVAYRHGFTSSAGAPLTGVSFTLVIWSTLPNDLEGVTFLLEQRRVIEGTTPEAWAAYQEAYSAWLERYRAWSDAQVASGRSHTIDSSPTSAEPPPAARPEEQPPRPSTNAEWIPGYWHRGEGWAWMAGFWRVPEADVEADLTVHAPAPPPPPRVEPEAEETKPAQEAVWTTGHWQWNGSAYVWVNGAWRIPPSTSHRWQASTWRRRGGGAVFVPGGWTVSIGGR